MMHPTVKNHFPLPVTLPIWNDSGKLVGKTRIWSNSSLFS